MSENDDQRRLYAVVPEGLTSIVPSYEGIPGQGGRRLPSVDVLVIEDHGKEGVFLYSLTVDDVFCGDTWHQSVAEAKEQARFEYGDHFGPWLSVPAHIIDAQRFAIAEARKLRDEGRA